MLARRKLSIVSLGLTLVLSTCLTLAQENKTRDATLGVLGISDGWAFLVDLNMRDSKWNAPYVYFVEWPNCPLKIGRTYKAKMLVQPSQTYPISIEGADYKRRGSITIVCGKDVVWPEGAHWEWSESAKAVCKPGVKETIKWKGDKGTSQSDKRANKNYPPCEDQPGFANTTLNVVITVKPAAGMEWKFPEGPSVVAAWVLQGLNQNTRNIIFQEANGVTPNLYLTVTLSETIEGTRQDTAYAEVTGLGKAGVLFRESSGEAPFTSPAAAIDKLSANMLMFFQQGWNFRAPCIQSDGSVRSH